MSVAAAFVLLVGQVAGPAPSASAATAPSGLHVSSNQILDAGGSAVRLIGVNRSGTEYRCIQGNGIFEGPSDAASVQAIAAWHTNAVRVPLNEDCWLGINGAPPAYSGANYQQAIADYVALLKSHGLAAILELHWSAAGTDAATGQQPMPDRDHSVTFWSQVASAFMGDGNVVFDLFNEPFPDGNQDTTAAWQCWRDGGTCPGVSFQAAGMQELVNAVRATGATNLILLGGVRYANALSQWLTYKPVDPTGNLAASWHAYNFNACATVSCWDAEVLPVLSTVPLVATEIGEDDCGSGFIEPVMRWLDGHRSGYLPWAWDNNFGCFSLVADYAGTPTQPYGAAFRGHLADITQLDSSFGVDGKVTTAIGSQADAANAVTVQADGKIVAAGTTWLGTSNGSDFDWALARYNADGSLDSSFGTGGKLTTRLVGVGNQFAYAVAVQSDQKIVAAGLANPSSDHSTGDDFAIARYNPDGSLDSSFGSGGEVFTDFASTPTHIEDDVPTSVAIQQDGKIVAAGVVRIPGACCSDKSEFGIARYNPNGTLDASFGTGGKVVTGFGPSASEAIAALALQPDGRIVAVGEVFNYTVNGFVINKESIALARYMPDGSLDTSFGSGGTLITAVGSGTDLANAVALQPDGRIVVAGYSNGPLADFAVVRYMPDGTLDSSFGGGGELTTSFGSRNDIAYGVGIQADGKIVATGYSDSSTSNAPDQDFALARYNPDGSLDSSFGSDGTLVTDFGLTNEIAQAMTFQRDGRIVVAGYSQDSLGDQTFALVRYFGGPPFATPPGAPTNVIAAAGDAQASVSWAPPISDGGSQITGYTVTSSGGQSATVGGSATTATVGSLLDGTGYRFTIRATNLAGTGPPSAASASVIPLAGAQGTTSTIPTVGGSATTDPGTGPTASDPLTTTVTVPTVAGGGSISIAETAATGTPPGGGYQFLGQQVDIVSTATTSTANPLTIIFTIDESAIRLQFALGPTAPLPDPDSVHISRTELGVASIIPVCTSTTVPLAQDPCVTGAYVPINGSSDLRLTVLTGTASQWNALSRPVSVSVLDSGYNPKNVTVSEGGAVVWTFQGSVSHSATDNLRLGPSKTPWFDSGLLRTGRYGYVFRAAGTYVVGSTAKGDPASLSGTIAVPVLISPTSGGASTSFAVTWSSASIGGYVFDVQYRFMKAGTKSWSTWTLWKNRVAYAGAAFLPTKGLGTYSFQARVRNSTTNNASMWSPETLITVH